jgi:hypothetical protein
MSFASVYPLPIQKVERKGRTAAFALGRCYLDALSSAWKTSPMLSTYTSLPPRHE